MNDKAEPTMPIDGPLRSAEIGKLAEALAKAQKAIKAPKKGKTAKITGDKGYSYNYADLADVIEAYRDPLADNGLALSHTLRLQDGHMVMVTTLWHLSGQFLGSEYPIPPYTRPQEQGSALTYARRYAVSALLGIAAEDDDDGQRAQDAKRDEPAAEAPPSGDAGTLLDLAAEIQQWDGGTIDGIIHDYSSFTGKDGKEMSFTDPTKVRSVKWLKGTRGKLESALRKLTAMNEPGAAEAAQPFKATDEDVPF